MTENTTIDKGVPTEEALAGILALLIDEREERTRDDKSAVRTEFLLAEAGMSMDQIATVTGKSYDAVRMAVNRARKAAAK